MFKRLRDALGLDFHVLITLVFRGWSVLAGAATVLLLPLFLSPSEQGYYYTFTSILALQIFFELGLGQIVVQLVSHEVAQLTESPEGYLQGDAGALGRLTSLARMFRWWYTVAAVLFVCIGGGMGIWFFSAQGKAPIENWLGPWALIVVSTAVNLGLSPGLAMIEGCGKVGQVARLRLIQAVLGYGALWLGMMLHTGLWVVAAVPFMAAFCSAYWLHFHGGLMRWLCGRPTDLDNRLSWHKDVFPFQWRIAVSWASGYFIFNLFTPAVFAKYGAIEAGRLGLALSIFSSISTVGMSWVIAKAPTFTMLIAQGERKKLNDLFRPLLIRSSVAICIVSALLLIFAAILQQYQAAAMQRVASLDVLAVLAGVTIVNSVISAMAIYMRAHREEPLLVQSLLTGLLVSFSVVAGIHLGIFVMMLSYGLIVLLMSFPWTIKLFLTYYRKK